MCSLGGCRSSTEDEMKETDNFRLYAPPLKSCDLRRWYHSGVMWRNGIEISGISELCVPPWLLVILGIGK